MKILNGRQIQKQIEEVVKWNGLRRFNQLVEKIERREPLILGEINKSPICLREYYESSHTVYIVESKSGTEVAFRNRSISPRRVVQWSLRSLAYWRELIESLLQWGYEYKEIFSMTHTLPSHTVYVWILDNHVCISSRGICSKQDYRDIDQVLRTVLSIERETLQLEDLPHLSSSFQDLLVQE